MADNLNYIPGGIGEDIRGTDVAKFQVSNENWKHVGFLTDVSYHAKASETEKDDAGNAIVSHRLSFTFRGAEFGNKGDDVTVPLLIHSEFPKLKGNDKYTIKDFADWQAGLFAHAYNTFAGYNKHVMCNNGKGLGSYEGERSWANYFKSLAKSFNEGRIVEETVMQEVDEMKDGQPTGQKVQQQVVQKVGRPIYKTKTGAPIKLWIKLTYDKTGNLGLPLFGNFMEKFTEGQESVLLSKTSKDLFTLPTANKKKRTGGTSTTGGANAATGGTGGASTDLPPGF